MPNLGALLAMLTAPSAMGTHLGLYDELTGATAARRRWHRDLTLGGMSLIALCWGWGVPHDRRLPWQFGGVSLLEGDRWRAATALTSTATLSLQAFEGMAASSRAVLHLYATGQERALCLRSSLYGLAQLCLGILTLSVSLRPAGQLVGHRHWPQPPTRVAQGLLAAVMLFLMLGNLAPLWCIGDASGPADTAIETAFERVFHGLYVLSCYRAVRRLAFALEATLPTRPLRLRRGDTGLLRLRTLAELDLLLQIFKTMINDARLVLQPYATLDTAGNQALQSPDRVAQALVEAQLNRLRDWRASQESDVEHPLGDAASFDDERFLAAVWRSYARCQPLGANGSRGSTKWWQRLVLDGRTL